jgi:hypothetical protein
LQKSDNNHPKSDPRPAAVGLLNPKATAEYLDLSQWTLAEWRVTGKGPIYMKLGNRVKYSLVELNAWLEARAARSTSEHDAKKAR